MTTTKRHPFDLSDEEIERVVTKMIAWKEERDQAIIKFYNERFTEVAKLVLLLSHKYSNYDSEDIAYGQVTGISNEDFSLFIDCMEAYAFEYDMISEMCEDNNPFGHFHIYFTYNNDKYVIRMITGQGTIYGIYWLTSPWKEWKDSKVISLEDLM